MSLLSILDQTEDTVVLRELFATDGTVSAYDLHRRHRYSPGQIYSAAQKLLKLGLVEVVEDPSGFLIKISEAGADFCVANAGRIWSDRALHWKGALPDRFESADRAVNVYYCPQDWAKR
jgi:hypothetical protein